MTSLFEILKTSKKGMAPDLFTALLAEKFGYIPTPASQQTKTGTPPIYFISDGTSLIAYSIIGNMTQQGTPTSASPIFPSECGERTANLFDFDNWYSKVIARRCTKAQSGNSMILTNTQGGDAYVGIALKSTDTLNDNDKPSLILVEAETTYTFTISSTPKVYISYLDNSYNVLNSGYRQLPVSAEQYSYSFTTPSNCKYIMFRIGFTGNIDDTYTFTNMSLVLGSTAPSSYIPYGYKLPIVCGGVTTNYYLREPIRKIGTYTDVASDTAVTRVIKKLVLTGQETGWQNNYGNSLFGLSLSGVSEPSIAGVGSISSHYTYNPIQTGLNAGLSNGEYAIQVIVGATALYIKNETYTTVSDWKNYLQQQYANGTPVTVWYVLATPTTESVTAPSIPTIDGEQTFDIDTTLKPSEVTIEYMGW